MFSSNDGMARRMGELLISGLTDRLETRQKWDVLERKILRFQGRAKLPGRKFQWYLRYSAMLQGHFDDICVVVRVFQYVFVMLTGCDDALVEEDNIWIIGYL